MRAAFEAGTPVVVRAASPEEVTAALARPEVACVLVPGGAPRPARARPDRAHVWLSRRDVLDRRLRPRGGAVGRRGPVEVPRRRLGRAVGRAGGRRDRDAGVREPALRARRARAPARRPRRERGRRAATSEDDGRDERQLGVVDGQGAAASWTGPGCNDWAGHRTGPGYAAQGNILVGAETVDALADDVRGDRAAAARAAADRMSRRGAGCGRRPARPAVGVAARRASETAATRGCPTSSSISASTTTSGRSRSCAGSTRCTTGCSG